MLFRSYYYFTQYMYHINCHYLQLLTSKQAISEPIPSPYCLAYSTQHRYDVMVYIITLPDTLQHPLPQPHIYCRYLLLLTSKPAISEPIPFPLPPYRLAYSTQHRYVIMIYIVTLPDTLHQPLPQPPPMPSVPAQPPP